MTFLVTIGSDTHSPSNIIVFDVAFLNSGSHYNTSTEIYTAPISGTYEFIIHILSSNDYNIRAYLVLDGTLVGIAEDEDIL